MTSLVDRFETLVGGPVVAGSPASAAGRVLHGEHAGRIGLRRLRTAIDHLLAWRSLTLVRAGGLAHVSLLRVAHENALAVRWLLEPGLSLPERVRRGVAARLTEHEAERRFEQALQVDPAAFPEPWRTAADEYDELLAYALTIGAARAGRAGRRPGAESAWPAVADLYARYGEAGARGGAGQVWVHRIEAGVADGMGWAVSYALSERAEGDLVPLFAALSVDAVGRAVTAAERYHTADG